MKAISKMGTTLGGPNCDRSPLPTTRWRRCRSPAPCARPARRLSPQARSSVPPARQSPAAARARSGARAFSVAGWDESSTQNGHGIYHPRDIDHLGRAERRHQPGQVSVLRPPDEQRGHDGQRQRDHQLGYQAQHVAAFAQLGLRPGDAGVLRCQDGSRSVKNSSNGYLDGGRGCSSGRPDASSG